MSELTAFEIRLQAALRRHVDAPTPAFDALQFARMVVSAKPRRRLLDGLPWRQPAEVIPWRGSAAARFGWLIVALLLVVALVVGAILAGGVRVPARWQRIDLPGAGSVSGAFATEQGCLAVGASPALNESPWYTPLLWRSTDCLHWGAATSASTLDGYVAAITAGAGGFIGVGGSSVAGNGAMAVWRSPDGSAWRRVATVWEGPSGRLSDVAFAHGRYVAVGSGPRGAEIWWSTDGDHWVPASGFVGRGQPGFYTDMVAVVAGGPGFVAVGGTPAGGVWTSADGDAWQHVDASPYDLRLFRAVAAGPGGLVLAFPGELLLISVDPTVTAPWTAAPLPVPADLAALGERGTIVGNALTATDWGYVAVGTLELTSESEAAQPVRGLVWTSTDGRAWTLSEPDATFAGVTFERVARSGDALLVTGRDSGGSLTLWAIAGGARSANAVP